VLWDEDQLVLLDTPDEPGGVALGIDERGTVTGWTRVDGLIHATVWHNGVPLDLGARMDPALPSVAYASNPRGQIVGETGLTFGTRRAVLWQDGRAIDLNQYVPPELQQQGLYLAAAWDINLGGTIVGATYNDLTGATGGYVLTPAIPELPPWLLLVPALALLRHRLRAAARTQRLPL